MVLFPLASLNTMEVGSGSQHLFKEYLETANEAATEISIQSGKVSVIKFNGREFVNRVVSSRPSTPQNPFRQTTLLNFHNVRRSRHSLAWLLFKRKTVSCFSDFKQWSHLLAAVYQSVKRDFLGIMPSNVIQSYIFLNKWLSLK